MSRIAKLLEYESSLELDYAAHDCLDNYKFAKRQDNNARLDDYIKEASEFFKVDYDKLVPVVFRKAKTRGVN